jgi:hypothetical protein
MLKSDYFKKINTYKKAYFLGFILGDGALVVNNAGTTTLTITVHERDKYILDKFAKDIGCERVPYKLKNYTEEDRKLWRFTISVKSFVNNLLLCGITPRKSLAAKNLIPMIPKKYRSAFILGVYDADGSFTFSSDLNNSGLPKRQYVQIRCTEEVATGILDELEIKSFHISRKDSIPNLIIGSKLEIIKMLSKMYYHCPVFLKRKRDKFNQLLNQVQTIS